MSEAQVISLGCRLNISESEQIRAMLAQERDVVVVNSCAVTSEAVRQTRQAIRRARRANPQARLLVTGCAADIEREQLTAMPEVDGLVANTAKLDARAWNMPVDTPPVPQDRTRAFIAVQNGCDHACTFCVIPQGRGPSRSLTIPQVLAEVDALARAPGRPYRRGCDLLGPRSARSRRLARWCRLCSTFPTSPPAHVVARRDRVDPLLFKLFASEQRLCRISISRCSTGTI